MTHTLTVSEIIMNQTLPNSQTSEIGTIKSPTSQRLRQHPTTAEMRPSFWSKAKPVLKEFAAIGLVVASAASIVLTIKSCANDVDRQEMAAIKHQLQFQGLNGSAR